MNARSNKRRLMRLFARRPWQALESSLLLVHVKSKTSGGGRKLRPPRIDDEELDALAEIAKDATDRAGEAIDNALVFIAASNKRIAALETKVAKP